MKTTPDTSLITINGLPPYSTEEAILARIFGGDRAKSYGQIAIQLSRTVEAAPLLARSTGNSEADIVISAVIKARTSVNRLHG